MSEGSYSNWIGVTFEWWDEECHEKRSLGTTYPYEEEKLDRVKQDVMEWMPRWTEGGRLTVSIESIALNDLTLPRVIRQELYSFGQAKIGPGLRSGEFFRSLD